MPEINDSAYGPEWDQYYPFVVVARKTTTMHRIGYPEVIIYRVLNRETGDTLPFSHYGSRDRAMMRIERELEKENEGQSSD